jgi:hypothetical protein
VHRYFGHRINFYQRKYRIFNELCDLGSLLDALQFYSKPWRRRRYLHQWQTENAAIIEAVENPAYDADERARQQSLRRARREAWARYREQSDRAYSVEVDEAGVPLRVAKINRRHPQINIQQFDDMSDIEDWHDDDMPDDLPDVIPEKFIWAVFAQLVDAFLVLGTGGVDEPAEGWQEIKHTDLHMGNIFLKKPENHQAARSNRVRSTDRHHYFSYPSRWV